MDEQGEVEDHIRHKEVFATVRPVACGWSRNLLRSEEEAGRTVPWCCVRGGRRLDVASGGSEVAAPQPP